MQLQFKKLSIALVHKHEDKRITRNALFSYKLQSELHRWKRLLARCSDVGNRQIGEELIPRIKRDNISIISVAAKRIVEDTRRFGTDLLRERRPAIEAKRGPLI